MERSSMIWGSIAPFVVVINKGADLFKPVRMITDARSDNASAAS